ncbi:ATP-binding protein [Alcaligenes endophyticus]|uniref:ATP-binding protein n=1 Tax=Alcaligenes endophyticus TaxID=1929088 RepID=A0ABT8EG38_9BURK|nr:ATP-binding protein [Alcaligenes endophyticus]MCX5590226.1 ATP-binding protein [Alcaligenes endophyticus]MDN4120110.1 ATP-binding protein [Alcaligenes endophyticus]
MNPVSNPFTPGAGTKPPELAGRDEVVNNATIAIQRANAGNQPRSQMLLGLRGVGKTVLLNKIEEIAKTHGHYTSYIEADEKIDLIESLNLQVQQLLKKLSGLEAAKHYISKAWGVFKSFLSNFNFTYGDLSINVEAEIGAADSGRLESDLAELFLTIGELLKNTGVAWTILIDEVQYLSEKDLSALIVALHRCNQKIYPIVFFGAGLPQLAAMSGDAKSYAERLFSYPKVGALTEKEAYSAISTPIFNLKESISLDALSFIYKKTKGYPYFIQEWGSEVWNQAEHAKEISKSDAESASEAVFNSLDNGFFNVRLDRLTAREKEYVRAMASLGEAPYKSVDVAKAMQSNIKSLSLIRSSIIKKGMIYSPSYGEVAFTVPLFDDFLLRNISD